MVLSFEGTAPGILLSSDERIVMCVEIMKNISFLFVFLYQILQQVSTSTKISSIHHRVFVLPIESKMKRYSPEKELFFKQQGKHFVLVYSIHVNILDDYKRGCVTIGSHPYQHIISISTMLRTVSCPVMVMCATLPFSGQINLPSYSGAV